MILLYRVFIGLQHASEMNQEVLVKKLDKIAKGKGFLSGPTDSPLALESFL